MKKKRLKIYSTVFAVTLVLYTVAGAFLLFVQHESDYLQFIYENRKKYSDIETLLSGFDDVYSEDANICLHQYSLGTFPAVFSVADSDGRLISSSRPAFIVDHSDENERYIDSFVVETYPYMDEETETSVIGFVQDCRYGCNLRAEWLSLYKDGERYIPVSALLYNANNPNDRKIAVRFTDFEPTFTTYEKNGSIIYLKGLNEIDSPQKAKYYKVLNTRLDAFLEHFSQTHDDIQYNGGGGFTDSKHYQFENYIVLNGVKLCFYYESEYDLYYKAFTSDAYRGMLIYMGFLFFAAALIIAVISDRINAKNERIRKSREAFISAAAHELKTPLAVIANKSECILEDVSPEVNKEYVNSIYDESKRMSRMVKTLLEYNKLSADKKTEKKKEPLSDIISAQADKYQPLFEAKKIAYSEKIEENITLNCNRDLMGLALDNLLSNAVKFTPDGGKIIISAVKIAGKVTVEIFNSGSRISDEDAPHIWEEMYSGDKSRARTDSSTGMGLAICRLIFELHRFDYGFRNVKDGVIFRFSEK